MDAVVVGAGLAGLSAAHHLGSAGVRVTVLEARDFVGGRTASWVDDGMPVESGLHRFLGVYAELPALLKRCGVDIDEIICWEDELEIRTPDGPHAVLGAAPLHKPLRVLTGIAESLRLLSPVDLVSLGPFLAGGLAHYLASARSIDQFSVTEYARKWGVTERAIERVLVPFTAGIFFLPPHRFAAPNFFGLVVPAIPRALQARVGAFMGGMTDVMSRPIADAIEDQGGRVRTGVSVDALRVRNGRVDGVRTSDGTVMADHVVLATELPAAQALLGQAFADHPWFQPMLALPTTSAATLQIELDAPSMSVDRTTFGPGTVLASFSEQSRTTFQQVAGRLSVILQPPEPFLDRHPDDVLEQVVSEGERLGLRLRGHVVRHRLITHPGEFPSLEPGHLHQRPTQRTPVRGLTLAGDYTKQRWLASMEGAVISGRLAAQNVRRER